MGINMTIRPGSYDITIYQGATYDTTFIWKDENGSAVNITGYSARLQARARVGDSNTIISLTDGAGITLGGSNGTIRVVISASGTAALTSGGVYDLELVSGAGVVTRLIQGNVTISKEVTR